MSENKKGNTILLTVVAIATLLVAIVGATFAYFTASVTGNTEAKSVIVKTAEIGTITYTNGTELKMENAYPGAYSNEITFTIATSGKTTVAVPYSIIWTSVTNTFTPVADLIYAITPTSKVGGEMAAVADKVSPVTGVSGTNALIGSGTLPVSDTAVTHSYTMKMHFKETGSDQNSNQGKSFTGQIRVVTGDASNNLYYTDTSKSGMTTPPAPY